MSEASKIVLESGVPIPSKSVPTRKSKYPFDDMQVKTNNTFFVGSVTANTMHAAVTRYKGTEEGAGKEFTVRTVEEVIKGQKNDLPQIGVRIWRIK